MPWHIVITYKKDLKNFSLILSLQNWNKIRIDVKVKLVKLKLITGIKKVYLITQC